MTPVIELRRHGGVIGLYTIAGVTGPSQSLLISGDDMHDCYMTATLLAQGIHGSERSRIAHACNIKIHHGSVNGRAPTCFGVQPDSCFPGLELLAQASVLALRVQRKPVLGGSARLA